MYLFIIIISIVCLLLSCYILWYTYKYKSNIDNINNDIQIQNKDLEMQNFILKTRQERLNEDIATSTQELGTLNQKIKDLNESIENTYENKKELSSKAFENYCEILSTHYQTKEKEFDDNVNQLNINFEQKKELLNQEMNQIKADLDKMKATRTAAIEAHNKEQTIKENKEFYMLCPKTADVDDIKRLERIKPDLHNPRILSMLIWSTFFQKPMTALCNKVLGVNQVTGIYKITNQLNDMCYIGQAVDVATRWKAHAKCGLDIDTPAGNKLYKAMKEDGIWNFSWELIEQCDKSLLDEKEKFYIELYQSKNFGYNTMKGNS